MKKTYSLRRFILSNILFIFFIPLFSGITFSQKLSLNDLEYFETAGFNVLVFSNQYTGFFFDEKTAGIELIHHGVRTSTGGGVRLSDTPEQWDLIPLISDRKVDKENNSIEVLLRYENYDFNSRVIVKAVDEGVTISVYLEKPLPEELVNHAGFNLEFLPASYFEKTYLMDGKSGIFPLYPSGPVEVKSTSTKIPQFANHSTFDERGNGEFLDPQPIALGKTLILAPEDPERRVKIQSVDSDLMLFDGRNVAQNGWYVVRTIIPSNKTGKVVEWHLSASTIKDWKRSPVITYSQVGYHPGQEKIAIIELDKNDSPLNTASLYQVTPEGEYAEVLTGNTKEWGKYFRYNYITFDFSSVKEPGLYAIKYGEETTSPFRIGTDVYNDVWHQTLDVWFPVQMDHMFVNEAYRVWHGRPYLDDALQAPINHIHFDGYSMDSITDTKYKPLEHIPGLAVGGWFDAGDFDIQTGSHCAAVLNFVNTWEKFRPERDETFISQETNYVDIHRPDGKPDLLQQIEHGTLQLVAQQKSIGHAVRGIVVPNLHQYHHLGDASTETDNLPYNPNLKQYETDGKTSGTLDDRWAFTNKIPWLNYFSIAALAAANRALQEYNKQLADESLTAAINAWNKEHKESGWENKSEDRWYSSNAELMAALQLFISTKDEQYSKRFNDLIWPALEKSPQWNIFAAAQALDYLGEEYRDKLKTYVEKYKDGLDSLAKQNPYGVPLETRGWGANTIIINGSIANYFLHKAFPEIIGPEYAYKGLNYIFGCHPSSNISFVSGVGTQSKKVAYGGNRADFTFIAGGVVPGLLILKPDFPENKEDWPFFWGENEYVVDICAAYIFLTNAINDLVIEKK